jgi:outer membrane protein
MKKISSAFCLLFTSLALSHGQRLLSPEDAVSIALKNNYDILVARNDADIDKTNNTAGNAGMLPNVALTGSDNYSLNSVHQKLPGGTETNTPSLNTNAINAAATLNWTLFDGGKMFVTRSKLNEIEALGELQFKDKVMQTVYNVIVAYYDVVRQKQQLSSINEAISYNKERVKILQTTFDAGLSAKNTVLQAKIDLNVYFENAVNQKTVIQTSRRTLNQLLSRDADSTFEVTDSIPLNYTPDKNALLQSLYQTNATVLALQKEIDVAKLSLKEYNSLHLPKVNFNAGYNFAQTDNPSSSVLQNRTVGPQIGGSINIPIFQAGNVNRQIATAKLQLQTAQYNLDNAKVQINTQLQNALTLFDNQQKLFAIERENFSLAKENLDISMQRLRLGQTTSLEVHLAQDSYEESLTRLINFQYNIKVAETKLKQLMAQL